jgi:hypothetical protein
VFEEKTIIYALEKMIKILFLKKKEAEVLDGL